MAGLATYRHNFYRRQRGAALFIFIVIIIGGVLTGALLSDKLLNIFLIKKQQEQSVLQARESLINYMLLRAGQPLNITGNQTILPRLLMLPCPDNLGDNILDGSQDPTCGASVSNKVNGILNSGSRFGRLPWRAVFPTDATIGRDIKDGLGRDFQDANGNRLWYAVSRKLVPAKNAVPLNFHHLAANDDDWLQMIAVNNVATVTVSRQVAAVILSPGKHKRERLPEDTIVTISMRYSDSQVDTDLYFEEIAGESNADKDGVFVQASPNKDFDDTVAYISFDELLREDGDFMRRFKRMAGIGEWQNAPLDQRPLARLRDAVNNWKNVFGFYPAPAANITVNVTTHFRHCAVADSGIAVSLSVTSLALLPPADLQITASLAVGEMATLTISGGDFLITAPHVVGGTSLTIATWARVSAATVSIVAPTAVLQTIGGGYQINAGVTVTVDGQIIIPRHTPINPGGLLLGWFPEYYKTTMMASGDNSTLVIKASTKTGFLGKIILTSAASTITLAAEDSLIFSRGQTIIIEKDYKHLMPFDRAIIHYADGTIVTLASGYKPVLSSYNKRHFVVLLHSDIVHESYTVFSPAVLYPWRTSPSASKRESLHPWPPCFDARDMPRELQTFIADNPIHYAVAENCHYGGEPSRCGQNGITLTIAPGAAIALPSAFMLTHSFTAHFDGVSVEINNGVAMASLALARPADLFIMNAAQTLAVIRLPFGFEFNHHQTVVIPAGIKMTGGEGARIDNIPALLIYSPAPLSRVACLGNAASGVMSNTATVTVDGKVAANQIGENLTYLCQWLDHDENADLDGQYELPRPQPYLSPPNDYFILLGGRAILE